MAVQSSAGQAASGLRSTSGREVSHSYFVTMVDYGRKGREAIVDPEITRREVMSRIQSREYDRIAFIHHIHDGVCEDVTNELLAEAGFYAEAAE